MVFYTLQRARQIKFSQKLHLYFIDDNNLGQGVWITCLGSLRSDRGGASTLAIFGSLTSFPLNPLSQLWIGHGTASRLKKPLFSSVAPASWSHDMVLWFICREGSSLVWPLSFDISSIYFTSNYINYLSRGSITKFCHFLAKESWASSLISLSLSFLIY